MRREVFKGWEVFGDGVVDGTRYVASGDPAECAKKYPAPDSTALSATDCEWRVCRDVEPWSDEYKNVMAQLDVRWPEQADE